uniref:Immunoglobulin V-set domain-containing protein n=1 Tax=Erpetoichthys calabaricus TaxID=27687 RepID=A0A8C4RYD9_ERPCA
MTNLNPSIHPFSNPIFICLFVCFLCPLGHGIEDRVWQPETLEKQRVEVKCNFETTDTTNIYLFWYIQPPSGFPRHLMTRASSYNTNEEGFKERFNATLNLIDKTVHLKISLSRLSDSAIYFCALRPTVKKMKPTQGTRQEPILDRVPTHHRF